MAYRSRAGCWSLHVQRAVSVLGRRRPRQQDLRHDHRVGHREGTIDGVASTDDDRRFRPHPQEHPRSRSHGRRSCSWTSARPPSKRTRSSACSPGSSAARLRPRRADRRGRWGRARADHIQRRGRQGSAHDRQDRPRRDDAVIGATGNPTTLAETVFSTIPARPSTRARRASTRVSERARDLQRGPPGSRRAPGPLPLRGLTEATMFVRVPPSRPPARPGDPRRTLLALRPRLATLWVWAASPCGHYLHHGAVAGSLIWRSASSPPAGS